MNARTMAGSESIAIIKAMDALRRQWEIAYLNDPI